MTTNPTVLDMLRRGQVFSGGGYGNAGNIQRQNFQPPTYWNRPMLNRPPFLQGQNPTMTGGSSIVAGDNPPMMPMSPEQQRASLQRQADWYNKNKGRMPFNANSNTGLSMDNSGNVIINPTWTPSANARTSVPGSPESFGGLIYRKPGSTWRPPPPPTGFTY